MPDSYDTDLSREPEDGDAERLQALREYPGGDEAFAAVAALEAIVDALAPLTDAEASRVLRWAAERFGAAAGETGE